MLKFPAYKEVTTSNPLLFISNTIDPVTSSLEDVIKFFPGAGKFYQNAVGVSHYASLFKTCQLNILQHGVLVTASNCTSEHTIKYVETGELPPPDVVCEPEGKVFDVPEAAA